MTTDPPEARALALIAEIAGPWVPPGAIVPGARLREDLGMDSLAKVALASRVGEDAGLEPGEGFDEFAAATTVGDVQRLVRALLGGDGPPGAGAPAPDGSPGDRPDPPAPPRSGAEEQASPTVRALALLLGEISARPLDVTRLDPDAPLRDLGFDSMHLVRFLVGIEERFAFAWDEDTEPQTFSTLAALAAHLDARGAAPTADADGPATRETAP